MNCKRVIPMLVTAACALGAVPASAAAATDVKQASSENWSGYVVGGSSSSKRFSSVSSSWTQPTAKCSSAGGTGYAAFWVGLGGSGQTEALEQAGTEADCSAGGQATYFAWYELVPKAPVRMSLTITPGDSISTRVSVSGTHVTIYLIDQTTGRSETNHLTMSNPDTSSAEWIAEAPSACDSSASDCSPLPLTDFNTINFSNAVATSTDGHAGSISDPEWSATSVALQSGGGSDGYAPQFSSYSPSSGGATPSSLSSDGRSFSVAYTAGSATTSGTGTSGAGGYGSGGAGGYGSGGGYGYGEGGYGYSSGGYGYSSGGYGSGYGGDPTGSGVGVAIVGAY